MSRAGRLGEDIANSVTHGAGLVLAIAGLVVLVVMAAIRGTAWHVVGCAVFGTTLVLLYGASTLYHSIPHPRARPVLKALDHSAIFLLIAGTYTPFMLVTLRGFWGWSLLAIVWTAAIAGVIMRASLGDRLAAVRVTLYIAMGWVAVVAFRPLIANLRPGGIALVVGGGLVYTLGVVFYARDRVPYFHAVWHGFVLGGSVLHFLAVLLYVIP